MKTALATVAVASTLLAAFPAPSSCYAPTLSSPAALTMTSGLPSASSSTNTPAVSRRHLLLRGAAAAALGMPVVVGAEEPQAPEKKKKTPEEKGAEKKREKEQLEDSARAYDASLGLLGCEFWGLKKKENSGACEPKPK
mmetsp:Transcript_29447/g.68820  ORF Transcript_29447/g.68820 Transcript_29447/m.68820 type:complete len:139 (-) Transcript_29447:252-668(-)|eukprot:CAMPEP_0114135362 /NCGR_PEP_ID=MMETSP0043_2-20121206/14658_1 /TAXON_ID=464988 /ORGANISM="Hemiselmis andersenii, Strain CCMP644" /LENGTH=138 /DNA_ID=CAMNT_0001229079 /DNA_START=82 /DNA_END=498 /DNA_ORIENTATION=-